MWKTIFGDKVFYAATLVTLALMFVLDLKTPWTLCAMATILAYHFAGWLYWDYQFRKCQKELDEYFKSKGEAE